MKTIQLQTTLSKRVDNVGYISKDAFPTWVRLAVWALQVPKAPYMVLGMRLLRLWKINGPTFVVGYTKECTRIIQAFVSGNPILVTDLHPISLKGGLPKIIPGSLRSQMRMGDLEITRAVLSVFAVYRIIKIPGKLKLSTILDPFKGQSQTLPEYELRVASGELFGFNKLRLQPIDYKLLGTAGPNSSVSMLGIWKDIKAWETSHLLPDLVTYCNLVPGGGEMLSRLAKEWEFLPPYVGEKPLILGRLSEKEEAAGKIRVFAITDCITQAVLAPLSDGVFEILRNLPMDGTFNQDQPVRHLLSLKDKIVQTGQTLFSYDLSAATDRLPVALQVQILSRLIGNDAALAWSNILTKRDWYYRGKPLRYSVGQPMGALSSWALLALTHHTIVRMAANRVGITNFVDYALLGDDIVIANENVARSYHALVTQTLGVEINLSKSLVSKNSFEFAKRLVTFKGEVSPVGAKNLLVGLKSLKGIPSILLDLVNKGVVLSEESVTNLYKSVPTVRKSQLESISWLVKGPFGFIPTADGLSTSIKLSNSLSAVQMDRFLSSIDEARYRLNLSIWERNFISLEELYFKLTKLETIDGFVGVNSQDSPMMKEILLRYAKHAVNLLSSKPIRRFIFDGPLVFTNYYRESWKLEMMSYIKSKLRDNRDVTVNPLDPFKVNKVILPLSSNKKVENFWLLVRQIEKEKELLSGFRGLV